MGTAHNILQKLFFKLIHAIAAMHVAAWGHDFVLLCIMQEYTVQDDTNL